MSNETITIGDVTYERHPYSAVFPLMAAEDYAVLLTSMRASGQRVSIKLVGDRQVFDGWNRLRACAELQLDPMFEVIPEDQDLQALTIALNLAHRHLTAGQKGLIAGQLATMTHGGQRPGTGAWQTRDEKRATVDLSLPNESAGYPAEHQDLKLDLDGHIDDLRHDAAQMPDPNPATDEPSPATNTIKAAAVQLGISRATAAMGKKVAESGDPALLDAVKSGDISLAEGYEIAKSPKEQQRDRVKDALANGKEWLKSRKKNSDFAEKLAKAVLKGDSVPTDLTESQLASVFLRVAGTMVVGTITSANCLNANAKHFTDSHMIQLAAAHAQLGEAIALRNSKQ